MATGILTALAVSHAIRAAIGTSTGLGRAGATAPRLDAAAGIRHRFHCAVSDTPNPAKVQSSHWNTSHIWATVAADPTAPVPGQLWTLATTVAGSDAPTERLLELKFCDPLDSVVVTLLSVRRPL